LFAEEKQTPDDRRHRDEVKPDGNHFASAEVELLQREVAEERREHERTEIEHADQHEEHQHDHVGDALGFGHGCRVGAARQFWPAGPTLQALGMRTFIQLTFGNNTPSSTLIFTRSCFIEARSRKVTVSFSSGPFSRSVSKSIVTPNGVPISSWRRYRRPIAAASS